MAKESNSAAGVPGAGCSPQRRKLARINQEVGAAGEPGLSSKHRWNTEALPCGMPGS